MSLLAPAAQVAANPHRYRLHRAGVLNVWQYDEQVFTFEGGRLLLRGANGAGKSKTLEMLLPFVLDGDKKNMTASARHHTSLLWLMQEGSTGTGTRTGYLWLELARETPSGERNVVTCGVGIRHSASAATAGTWFFTLPCPVIPLADDDSTPLSAPRCREAVTAAGGQFFDRPREYKEHVGRLLFGLDPQRYDDLLRLLYWLRQPQVGEDIDVTKLAGMLSAALPALDEDAVREVGDNFDELAEHGERVERLARSADALVVAAELYERYARGELAHRVTVLREADDERRARERAARSAQRRLAEVVEECQAAAEQQRLAEQAVTTARAQVAALEAGPLARNQQVLHEKRRRAQDLVSVADAAATRVTAASARLAQAEGRVAQEGARVTQTAAGTDEQARRASAALGVAGVAGALVRGSLSAAEPADALAISAGAARSSVSQMQAAVTVVRGAISEAETAARARDDSDRRAEEAEERAELATGRAQDAIREARAREIELLDALRAWATAAATTVEQPFELPDALSSTDLDELPRRARGAAEPLLARLQQQIDESGSRESIATRELAVLADTRSRVLAERDPAPPSPQLDRPSRAEHGGVPLWRLVDTRPARDAAGPAALIEAALQASGLLDAAVLPGGALLAATARDTVLVAGDPVAGPTLAEVLVPALPEGCAVSAATVAAALAQIALVDTVTSTGRPAVGRDGSWSLGPLAGRATKPTAQYLGASARAAERARRIAEVEASISAVQAEREAAAAAGRTASERRAAVRAWLEELPSASAVRTAWVRLAEREDERDRASAEATLRAEQAARAGEVAGLAWATARRLAAQHGLPDERGALDARSAALVATDRALERLVTECAALVRAFERLDEAEAALVEVRSAAALAGTEAATSRNLADEAQAESDALLATLGADVQRLQAELDTARQQRPAAAAALQSAQRSVAELTERRGETRAAVEATSQRLDDARPAVTSAATAVSVLAEAPGLLAGALGRALMDTETAGLAALRATEGALVGAAALLIRSWSDVAEERTTDANRVYEQVRSLAAGPAAETEPRVVVIDDALVLLARDDTGAELPLREVAARLTGVVVRERQLLTDRERSVFEEHLLGELGSTLRARRAEASDLIAGMNALLEHVRTSQGIRVRLDWTLREDAGSDVRDAVALLARPLGALLAEEKTRLRDALRSLIEVQRSAEPELGYAEHLARSLDYRTWSQFRVRITRPEQAGWTALTRRTPLSQGEQKVVCYLPLFAAAAAHFTSVAGAAPHAPRLVLLDDAFPKIDVNTHPLLFGLLVDLDLDFVITSERLWGDCATVPSLAIYEALRSPSERGIAQYRYVWDGRALVAEGA